MPCARPILIADDNPDDLFLLKRSFDKIGVLNPIMQVRSGMEAIGYLSGEAPYNEREKYPLPGILLLDLNMPNGSGFDVLEWLRDKSGIRGMLVIVLSRLDEIKNINRAYALGANSFLTKPGDPREVQEVVRVFRDYWLVRNKGPTWKAQ